MSFSRQKNESALVKRIVLASQRKSLAKSGKESNVVQGTSLAESKKEPAWKIIHSGQKTSRKSKNGSSLAKEQDLLSQRDLLC